MTRARKSSWWTLAPSAASDHTDHRQSRPAHRSLVPTGRTLPAGDAFAATLRSGCTFRQLFARRRLQTILGLDFLSTHADMPFGLRNTAQTFQCFMDRLFKHLPFVFCYLDDLIIASRTLEEHNKHLRQICSILQENKMNPTKCVFAAAVEFLGHRVDQHGVRPLQRHVQAISDPPPLSGCETITTVFRYGELYGEQTFPSRYRPHAPTLDRRTQRDPKTLEWPSATAFKAAKTALVAAVPLAHPAPKAVPTNHWSLPCSAPRHPGRPANNGNYPSLPSLHRTSDTHWARTTWWLML
jgi:hypothetical protein